MCEIAPLCKRYTISMVGYIYDTSLEIFLSPRKFWIRQRAIECLFYIRCKIKVKHGHQQPLDVQIIPQLENDVVYVSIPI